MSQNFGDYRDQRNGFIHINNDLDANNLASSVHIPAYTNESPNSFHTMLNRVRQHTNSNNVHAISALRSLISNSNLSIQGFPQTGQTRHSFHYTPLINQNSNLNNPAENVNFFFNEQRRAQDQIENPSNMRRSRLENDLVTYRMDSNLPPHAHLDGSVVTTSNNSIRNESRVTIEPRRQDERMEEDTNNNNNNNFFSDMSVRFWGNFVHYLFFLIILLVKFIYDNLLGILDIAILQIVIWFLNKSLVQQVSKLSGRNIFVLIRDMGLVAATVAYHFLLSSWALDPLGLMINPPAETITIEVSSNESAPNMDQSPVLNLLKKYISTPNMRGTADGGNALHVTKGISLGLLLYYVVINDLVLKLLTIGMKIFITFLPNRLLRHSQRLRLYMLVEYFSQFYRSVVPMRLWGKFLFESYTGLGVITGIVFCASYIGAKGLEFANRGKVLKIALLNFVRNIDYEKKPTKVELDAPEQNCPICHDTYNSPVILTCNHIFCNDCIGQWFKREQTCPMCRAKVSEEKNWQDGSTTFFYQLC